MKLTGIFTIAVLSFLLTFATDVNAQAKTKKAAATVEKYVCPNCSLVADSAGRCSYCKMQVCKVGGLYCTHCGTSPSDSGKCVYCKNTMLVMKLPNPNYKIGRNPGTQPKSDTTDTK
ncbi:MAG: hypothetical protein IPO27_05480 [Bacteroidetes bacterium]|nr:hypothetical protein [Bacteroidota bacterium]